jgi:hypothetical protein
VKVVVVGLLVLVIVGVVVEPEALVALPLP